MNDRLERKQVRQYPAQSMLYMRILTFQTSRQQELLDVTAAVHEAVTGMVAAAVVVYCPHTTAGIVINEHADPDVAHDMLKAFNALVPDQLGYLHGEGNSPAHVKAALVGPSHVVPLEDGHLALGIWQGIFLAEFDGPRRRRLFVTPIG